MSVFLQRPGHVPQTIAHERGISTQGDAWSVLDEEEIDLPVLSHTLQFVSDNHCVDEEHKGISSQRTFNY